MVDNQHIDDGLLVDGDRDPNKSSGNEFMGVPNNLKNT